MITHNGQLVGLLVRVACTSVIGFDSHRVLTEICVDLPGAVDAAGAVIMLSAGGQLFSSDPSARLLGDAQSAAGTGPLPHAIRSGLSLFTADLTWVGPPALAAAAADVGLTSSAALPLRTPHRRDVLGGLQVFGAPGRPLDASALELLRPVADVLATTLDDAAQLRRLLTAAAAPAEPSNPVLPGQRSADEPVPRHRRAR